MIDKKTCKELVSEEWESRQEDLEKLLKAYYEGKEDKELGDISEYGLSIDKVEAGTFKGQREDYIRYQFSWCGPSDELRIYKNGEMEYWYLDCFDGASVDVTNDKIAEQVKDYVMEFMSF